MPRDGLIPTHIVNKNGVQTTVYKRIAGKATEFFKRTPQPQVNHDEDNRRLLVQDLKTLIASERRGYPTPDRIAATLIGYPKETLEILQKYLLEDEHASSSALRSLLMEFVLKDEPASTVNEFDAFIPKPHDDEYSFSSAKMLLAGIREYTHLGTSYEDDYTKTNAATRNQVLALVTITKRVHDHAIQRRDTRPWEGLSPLKMNRTENKYEPSLFLRGDGLIEFIVSRPDDADRIADIMLEELTAVPERIKSVLDNGRGALDNGML